MAQVSLSAAQRLSGAHAAAAMAAGGPAAAATHARPPLHPLALSYGGGPSAAGPHGHEAAALRSSVQAVLPAMQNIEAWTEVDEYHARYGELGPGDLDSTLRNDISAAFGLCLLA
jgi:hypothetical protein